MLEAAEPPHFGHPMHIHTGIAEAFYVLEGEYHIATRYSMEVTGPIPDGYI